MLQASNQIKVALVSAINGALGVPVRTVIEPNTDNRYVYLRNVAETSLDEKRAFLGRGVVEIHIIEKFADRGGSQTWVDASAVTISNTLTPTRMSTFGNLSGITIFSMRITDNSEDLRVNESGRSAVKTLRLEYLYQTT